MQKPEALSGCAWCNPPEGLNACESLPLITSFAATIEAPTARLVAS